MNADLIFICHLFLPRVEAPFTDKFCDLGHELEINIDQWDNMKYGMVLR